MATTLQPRPAAITLAALAAAAPLLAMASERFAGLVPCALCLWQRWPYWVAVVIALVAAGLRSRLLLAAAGVVILGSAAVAGLHVGVEQGWWPSPLPACSAQVVTGAATVEDLMRGLAAAPSKPCDAPTYLIPDLPLSMAAMNGIYALALAALALTWARRRTM
ncbi:disulfide bond formation protein B [Roseomonas sp. CCTCC AB2023176]|uniref:disulfide bond formation protein B n=1 Tax=Roseomonas sp. CCTCC AB2023176 TaxID=3342640 RepID=UPI0035DBB22B